MNRVLSLMKLELLDPDISSLDNLRSLPNLRKAVLLIDSVIKGMGKSLFLGIMMPMD